MTAISKTFPGKRCLPTEFAVRQGLGDDRLELFFREYSDSLPEISSLALSG